MYITRPVMGTVLGLGQVLPSWWRPMAAAADEQLLLGGWSAHVYTYSAGALL